MRCINVISDQEMIQYSRQIRLAEIGLKGQKKLKGSSVIVIGAGALGCPVLQYLTAAGIGMIGIVDNDCVDETNLQRQVLYGIKDLNRPKPLAAKERLKDLNPEVAFNVHYIRFNRENALDLLKFYDVVVDCTDNFSTRYLINDASVILKKPVVYGAINRFSGQLVVLNHRNGPTLRCIYPTPPHPLESPSCDETGVLGSVAGTIGTMQATEVFKIILGLDGVLSGKLFFIDSLNFTSQVFTFSRDPAVAEIVELGEYPDLCITGKENINEISLTEFKILSGKYPGLKVIDLRDDEDKNDLGIDSISVPFQRINQKLDQILVNGPKVFYCNYGIKSSLVITFLSKIYGSENLFRLVI